MNMSLFAQWRDKINFAIFFYGYLMELLDVFIIKEVFLILISKGNFLHEEVYGITFLQLLYFLDSYSFWDIFVAVFV